MSKPLTVLACAVGLALCAVARADDAELGRRLYREGVRESGAALVGIVEGDVEVKGPAAACVQCHRRSGLGSNEGASVVPPITGPALFRSELPRRAELFRSLYQEIQPDTTRAVVRTPRIRAPYSGATLARALREGVDPSGKKLAPLMPRYNLSDAEVRQVAAYLGGLGASADPGVDDRKIHIATILPREMPEGRRGAATAVLEAYFRRKNLETHQESLYPQFSPHYKSEFASARREWDLHIWELRGPESGWAAQLADHYRRQPVFAILGGVVDGSWGPIHTFCEREELPCLFPNTDLPDRKGPNRYTLYCSEGLALEAKSLASWLAATRGGGRPGGHIQIYRDDTEGRLLAGTFRSALPKAAAARLEDRPLATPATPSRRFWTETLNLSVNTDVVIWLSGGDLVNMASTDRQTGTGPNLYFSGGLLGLSPSSEIPRELPEGCYLTYPYALPGREDPHIYRLRAWLRSRSLQPARESDQMKAYLAAYSLETALMHMGEHFSRDNLLERIENEMENSLNPGLFPRMSLGPGQRFASKGCYIVRRRDSADGGVEAISEWLVP